MEQCFREQVHQQLPDVGQLLVSYLQGLLLRIVYCGPALRAPPPPPFATHLYFFNGILELVFFIRLSMALLIRLIMALFTRPKIGLFHPTLTQALFTVFRLSFRYPDFPDHSGFSFRYLDFPGSFRFFFKVLLVPPGGVRPAHRSRGRSYPRGRVHLPFWGQRPDKKELCGTGFSNGNPDPLEHIH